MKNVNERAGTPVGRRLVLGMLGLGAAGVAVGSSVQKTVNKALAPINEFVPVGGGFRYYSVTDSVKRLDEQTYRHVAWSGVAMPDLLKACGADPKAAGIMITSFDGEYTESLTMAQAMRMDVLVASSMLGAPVTHDHGGPVRLFVAPMYGYKSLKWLGGIEVVDKLHNGYWEVRGYDTDAWVGKSNGRDDDPIA
jgi:DMSO/TMAO reductase YedYZ molybdopterin-dependent catalytic subunit